jgi:CBS domain-containing protein
MKARRARSIIDSRMLTKTARNLSATSVRDAMHRGVFTCRADASALTATRVMAAHRVHAVAVVDEDGRCRGLISEPDIAAAIHDGQLTQTAFAISAPPLLVQPEDSVVHAAELMHAQGRSHVVVVDPTSRTPVGMLSVLDLVELLAVDE